MIVQSDIVDILYKKAQSLGMPVYRKGNIPLGEVKEERIVIIPKSSTPERYWAKSYVEVNICVPNINRGKANLVRLAALEKNSAEIFREVGMYDNTRYKYEPEKTSIEEDENLKCHYVNVRVLFKVLNT